jgi:hypothetical protein
LFAGITVKPVLDPAKDHFHKNGLRACPAAKYSSKNHSEKNDENNESEKANGENEKILRPENLSKENELALYHIEKKQRLPIYLNKW